MQPLAHQEFTQPPPRSEERASSTVGSRWQSVLFSWGFVPALLFVSLALRLWSISRIEMISRDGYFYCLLARKINDGYWLTAAADWFLLNPYPPLITLLTRLTGFSYEFSGQLLCAIPAGLAVLPLYFWARSAFGLRVAQITAWMYALHPILIRTSADVMREGLYWFLMLTAVWILWEAVQRASWILYLLGGVLATAATLTRIEGAALFPLVLLWSAWKIEPSHVSSWFRIPTRRTVWRWTGAGLACAVFPALVLTLNMTLLPAGKPLLGLGRFYHLAQLVVNTFAKSSAPSAPPLLDQHGTPPALLPTPQKNPEQEPVKLASAETSPVVQVSHEAASPPVPTTVRQLAKSLPVWNSDGVADPVQYRLQRFVLLADDHREAIYIAHFIIRLIQGILVPVLIWFAVGLATYRTNWVAARDWPLLLLSISLVGLFFFHLATENVLEPRYLFCLIPFLFPWSAIGILEITRWIHVGLERRGKLNLYRPLITGLCVVLVTAGIVHSAPRNDFGKTQQKALGILLRTAPEKPLSMTGLESLRRIGYYADAEFRVMPQNPQEAYEWLKSQPVKYVILGGKERAKTLLLEEWLARDPRYARVHAEDPAFPDYQVFRIVQ
ncbi:MAG: glycosyltransferase family 39 protein [Planctomycetales bacterium]